MQIVNHRLQITSWSGESQYNRLKFQPYTCKAGILCKHKLMVYRMEQNPE